MSTLQIVWFHESLVSLSLVTERPFSEERCNVYGEFLSTHFGAVFFAFEPGSIKTNFFCPFSRAKAGIYHIISNGALVIANDKIKRGHIRLPNPGSSVWSGTKYVFKTAAELESVTLKIEHGFSRIDKLYSWKLPAPTEHKKIRISYPTENKEISQAQVKDDVTEIEKQERQVKALEYFLFYDEEIIVEQKKIAEEYNCPWLQHMKDLYHNYNDIFEGGDLVHPEFSKRKKEKQMDLSNL